MATERARCIESVLDRSYDALQHPAAVSYIGQELVDQVLTSLDSAVVAIHAMAEYAVNALLELAGQKTERHHKTGDRARELKAGGQLQGDYKKILDQLENYRLAAQYLGYGRIPSVHYNATNIEECLFAVDQLVGEVAAALRVSGKLE